MMGSRDYEERYPRILPLQVALKKHLTKICSDIPHVDRISCRVKTPASFDKKAARLDAEGWPIYAAPMSQIQDQIGACILVLYLSDIQKVAEAVLPYFREAEHQTIEPNATSFGYFGEHWLLALSRQFVPPVVDLDDVPPFFELQIKTLFQYAWSEAEHDLGYKTPHVLSVLQRRLLAYASAQAWGADRIFDELFQDLAEGNEIS